MNDMIDVAALPQGVAEALANGTIADPFSTLGPHETELGRVVRVFLPGALAVEVLARGGGDPLGRLAPAAPHGLFVGPSPARDRMCCASLGRRGAGDRGSLRLRAAARRARSAPVRGREASRPRLALGASVDDGRRRRRRAVRGVGAECAPRVGGRRLQQLGRPPPPDAAAPSGRRVGDVRSAARPRGHATNTSILGPDGMSLPLKADPVALATELPPAHRVDRRSDAARRWHGRGVDAGAGASDRRPTRRSRSTKCMPDPGFATRTDAPPSWDELAERLIPYVERDGLHPCRAHAGDGASVRRLVGLSAARPVRAERPARHAGGLRRASSMPATGRRSA